MFVAIAIVTLLMMVVVPQFESIFEQMLRGAPLPGPTQVVVDISELFSSNPILGIGRYGRIGYRSCLHQKDKARIEGI